jgi:hypothetical protein
MDSVSRTCSSIRVWDIYLWRFNRRVLRRSCRKMGWCMYTIVKINTNRTEIWQSRSVLEYFAQNRNPQLHLLKKFLHTHTIKTDIHLSTIDKLFWKSWFNYWFRNNFSPESCYYTIENYEFCSLMAGSYFSWLDWNTSPSDLTVNWRTHSQLQMKIDNQLGS